MTEEKKTRLFIRNLKSVGLVDGGANRGAHLLISKRHDDEDEIDAATPAEKSLLRKTLDVILGKQANVGNLFESLIHRDFTVNADQWFGDGMLTREERIALSNSIGAALDAFRSNLEEVAPELYERAPWDEPLETVTMSESASTLRKEEGALPEAREENQMPETPGLDSEIRDQLPEEARKYLDEIEARLVDAEDSSKAEEEVAPDLSKREDLPEDVRKALTLAEERAEAAEKRAEETATRIAKLEAQERISKATDQASEFESVIGKAEEFAPVLLKIEDALTDDEFASFVEKMKSAEAVLDSAEIFKEIGRGGVLSDAESVIDGKAKELAKSEGVSYEVAYKRVLDNEPELRKRLAESEADKMRSRA